jgi:hypothetical protein
MFLAAHPAGHGAGTALLTHHLTRLDTIGRSAYLEASAPRSVVLYSRHGFRRPSGRHVRPARSGSDRPDQIPPAPPRWQRSRTAASVAARTASSPFSMTTPTRSVTGRPHPRRPSASSCPGTASPPSGPSVAGRGGPPRHRTTAPRPSRRRQEPADPPRASPACSGMCPPCLLEQTKGRHLGRILTQGPLVSPQRVPARPSE